jgi:malate dehydrogenase (oxaloacetate-decarboxylating)(NADP+)
MPTAGPAKSPSHRPSRWRRSATCRSPIRPASPCPCLASPRIPDLAYDYTSKGNMVAVISNGTAILGLGNLGALASKPVMEGKAVLFKRFADVDSIDIEVDDTGRRRIHQLRPQPRADLRRHQPRGHQGPECFIIEQRLRDDDRYSGLPRRPARHRDHRRRRPAQCVRPHRPRAARTSRSSSTAPARPAVACIDCIKQLGCRTRTSSLCDTKGVVYRGRTERHEPVEVRACDRHQGAHAGRRDRRAPTCSWAFRSPAR